MSPDDRAPHTGSDAMNTPQHDALPDEGMIHEWLDGQLDAQASARFEALVSRSPEFAARVAEARGFVAASSRILSALDDVPAGVLPRRVEHAAATHATTPDTGVRSIVSARPRRPTFTWQRWAGAAAVLLVAVTGTMVLQREAQPELRLAAEAGPAARIDDVAAAAPSVAPVAMADDDAAPGAPPGRASAEVASSVAAKASVEVASSATAGSSAEVVASAATVDMASSGERTRAVASVAAPSPMARGLAAAPEPSSELGTMRSDLPPDDLQFAVQRVECAAQCRQVRVEIAADGRLRRWTSSLGRSATPDSGRVSPVVLAQLVQLQDSLALSTLPPVVPLLGAQCRTVGSLRESLRIEFRHDGRLRAITSVPWCDAPQHPLAAMARAVEQAAMAQLGAP